MSGQNRSSAVMQQRAEAHDSLDDFPTHPWAVRALCEKLQAYGHDLSNAVACDPACNRGFLVRPLAEYFREVVATDIYDYGYPGMSARSDYLLDWPYRKQGVDWIITNPPFRLAVDFILRALQDARVGVAMFVRVAFDEGAKRYRDLFELFPEAYAFPFVERVPLHARKLRDPNELYFDPKANKGKGAWIKPSTATAYQWLVWLKTDDPASVVSVKSRIAPCRDRLIRSGDYPIRYPDERSQLIQVEKGAGLV